MGALGRHDKAQVLREAPDQPAGADVAGDEQAVQQVVIEGNRDPDVRALDSWEGRSKPNG